MLPGRKKVCSSERQELPEEELNISWDLPAPRDSNDPATFQNMGLENSLRLTGKQQQLTSVLLKALSSQNRARAGRFWESRERGSFPQITGKLNNQPVTRRLPNCWVMDSKTAQISTAFSPMPSCGITNVWGK